MAGESVSCHERGAPAFPAQSDVRQVIRANPSEGDTDPVVARMHLGLIVMAGLPHARVSLHVQRFEFFLCSCDAGCFQELDTTRCFLFMSFPSQLLASAFLSFFLLLSQPILLHCVVSRLFALSMFWRFRPAVGDRPSHVRLVNLSAEGELTFEEMKR